MPDTRTGKHPAISVKQSWVWLLLIWLTITAGCNDRRAAVQRDSHEDNSPRYAAKSKAADFLAKADSVLLIRHLTYDRSPPDPEKGVFPEGAELLSGSRINEHMVIERKRISKADIEKLASILDEPVHDDITYTACFDPHHTIVAFRKEAVAYIDLCFTCFGLDKKDFPFDTTMSYQKYENLSLFFRKKGIETGIK